MEIILLERIPKLGLVGDNVRVKPGYARNYLFPQQKALKNTAENRRVFEERKIELEARDLQRKEEAEATADKLRDREFVIIRSASDTGSLYGSVAKKDIAQAASEQQLSVGKEQLDLERPIKQLGSHPIEIMLHPEVAVTIHVIVARTDREAKKLMRPTESEKSETEEGEEDSVSADAEAEPSEAFS
ncbi:MAG: 50S ribosomal protein L9 [Rhodobacteraceae bacterium]|nr:50S ribosomal protein L9 [Paracoccaceae bacterium]